jgi:hypothetical protein
VGADTARVDRAGCGAVLGVPLGVLKASKGKTKRPVLFDDRPQDEKNAASWAAFLLIEELSSDNRARQNTSGTIIDAGTG